jgi:hypothetical protein
MSSVWQELTLDEGCSLGQLLTKSDNKTELIQLII